MSKFTIKEVEKDDVMITKINKIFHDVESESYENNHPEIFDYESEDWCLLFKKIKSEYFRHNSVTVLDIGTGTGFVPRAISNNLSSDDCVIMTDISTGMLNQARIALSNFNFKKEFILIQNKYKSIPSSSVDIITMNSVLHHISNTQSLFIELERILKPGGCLIIKHEPNIKFVQNRFLRTVYLGLRKVRDINSSNMRLKTPMYQKVVSRLEQNGVTFKPALTPWQLQSLVDIHSPTAAGGMSTVKGFNLYDFADKFMSNSKLIENKTYGFFGKIREDSNFIRKSIASIFKFLYPNDGYFFDVVIMKNK